MSTTVDTDVLALMDAANEYWKTLIEKVPNDTMGGRWGQPDDVYTPVAYGMVWEKGEDGELHYSHRKDVPNRNDLVAQYSWAIPSPEALRWLLDHIPDHQGIIEIGAGTGYWASLLTLGGADVVAFDKYPPDQGENWFHSPHEEYDHTLTQEDVDAIIVRQEEFYGAAERIEEMLKEARKDDPDITPYPHIDRPPIPNVGDIQVRMRVPSDFRREIFFPVQKGSIEKLNLFRHRALLLSWPPYDDPLAYEALQAFPGDTLFYIGEGQGGCTANDDFFALLEAEWELVADCPHHISWGGIRDYLTLYRRKS